MYFLFLYRSYCKFTAVPLQVVRVAILNVNVVAIGLDASFSFCVDAVAAVVVAAAAAAVPALCIIKQK